MKIPKAYPANRKKYYCPSFRSEFTKIYHAMMMPIECPYSYFDENNKSENINMEEGFFSLNCVQSKLFR